MLSPHSRDDNENRPHAYHRYHLTEGQGDRATPIVPTMATMATTNAMTNLDYLYRRGQILWPEDLNRRDCQGDGGVAAACIGD